MAVENSKESSGLRHRPNDELKYRSCRSQALGACARERSAFSCVRQEMLSGVWARGKPTSFNGASLNPTAINYAAPTTEARLGLFGHLRVPSLTPVAHGEVGTRASLARESLIGVAEPFASEA